MLASFVNGVRCDTLSQALEKSTKTDGIALWYIKLCPGNDDKTSMI